MNKPTISEKILLKYGYKKYLQPESKRVLYQKKFTDKKGIKFFIDCYHDIFDFPNKKEPKSWWTFSIQFELEDGNPVEIKLIQWFNEDGIYSKKNHLHAEDYLEKMWMKNGSPYYEKYENEGDEE